MSKSAVLLLVLVLLTALCLGVFLPVQATPRTIVVPDDYSNIQAAVDAANRGDTIFIKKGTYEEPNNQTLLIDKTLALVGENVDSTIIKLYPAFNVTWVLTQAFYAIANAVTIVANDVRLSNLTIMASPGGDISINGDRTQIVGTKIATKLSIKGSHNNITGNIIDVYNSLSLQGSFNTIVRNYARNLYLNYSDSNLISNNTCYSIALHSSHQNFIYGNKLETTEYWYSGISLANSNNNTICRNKVSGFNFGLSLFFSSRNTIIANTIADSGTTINLGGSFNNTFCLNNFVDNKYWYNSYVGDQFTDPWFRDAYPNMTVSSNLWHNGSLGNHWGNYNGSDTNRDGIGEIPYVMKIVVRYFGDSKEEVVCGRDDFPLISKVDINSVNIEFPEWLVPILPEHQEPEPQRPETLPIALIAIAILLVTVAAIVSAGLLAYRRKRRREAAQA